MKPKLKLQLNIEEMDDKELGYAIKNKLITSNDIKRWEEEKEKNKT